MDDPNTVSPEVQDFGPSQNLLDDKPLDDSSPDAARVLDDLLSQQHVLDDVPIIQKAALSRAQSSHQSVVARHRHKRTDDRSELGLARTELNRLEAEKTYLEIRASEKLSKLRHTLSKPVQEFEARVEPYAREAVLSPNFSPTLLHGCT